MSFDINTGWVTSRDLTPKEKEILILTAKAAGLNIYSETERHVDDNVYPRLYYNIRAKYIASTTSTRDRIPVEYDIIMETLRSIIKSK